MPATKRKYAYGAKTAAEEAQRRTYRLKSAQDKRRKNLKVEGTKESLEARKQYAVERAKLQDQKTRARAAEKSEQRQLQTERSGPTEKQLLGRGVVRGAVGTAKLPYRAVRGTGKVASNVSNVDTGEGVNKPASSVAGLVIKIGVIGLVLILVYVAVTSSKNTTGILSSFFQFFSNLGPSKTPTPLFTLGPQAATTTSSGTGNAQSGGAGSGTGTGSGAGALTNVDPITSTHPLLNGA